MKKMLNKIGKSWKENRVLFVLTTIIIICVILMVIVLFNYFLGTKKDKYGDRLEGIKNVEITKTKIDELEKKIEEDEKITKVNINQIGKNIYVIIYFDSSINLVEAQSKATNTIEYFDDKVKDFYDIKYSLIQKKAEGVEGFTIEGSKNVNGSGLSWENNTPVTEGE